MARFVRDVDLAAKLRVATSEGETAISGDGDRFLVVPVPKAVELTDAEETQMALAPPPSILALAIQRTKCLKCCGGR